MDNIEWTKIAGAALAALLLIFLPKTFIEMRAERGGDKVGYALPGAEPAVKAAEATGGDQKGEAKAPAAGGEKAADPKAVAAAPAADGGGGSEIVALLAKASAENGKAEFKICSGCHAVQPGKNAVGPSLWGIVNRKKAGVEGFGYSEAMKAKAGEWTFENLSAFLKSPKAYVAGTKMAFAGIKDPQKEADIIAYLATLADTPVPLPK